MRDRAVFLVVYQREPHAGQMAFRDVPQPQTYAERCSLALKTIEELKLSMPFLIDTMDDLSRDHFGDLPSPAIIIGPDGNVASKLVWAEPEKLGPALEKALAEAKTSAPPEGPTLEEARRRWKDAPRRLAAHLAGVAESSEQPIMLWKELVEVSAACVSSQQAWALDRLAEACERTGRDDEARDAKSRAATLRGR